MALPTTLQLVLVTPEKTVLDEPVAGLQLPLYDGQIGILPGRAPMVGRLGYGELRIADVGGGERSYFVDGGFVQVAGPVVSVLTNRALEPQKLDFRAAEQQLDEVRARVPTTDVEFVLKDREEIRARQMLRVARRAR
ncbi:MAG: F0F1 ATP synthase subunit epsilon [Planctomycetes bacterium]|nr:F0F1 ATP synthase subunit epsilon [Planctomycetota bacterium]